MAGAILMPNAYFKYSMFTVWHATPLPAAFYMKLQEINYTEKEFSQPCFLV